MKKKHLISLTIGFTFLAMSVTGILLYFKQKPHFVEITHTLVGLLFTGFAVFHIVNNWSSIMGYSKERKTGKYQKELWYAALIAGVVIVGGLTEILEPVAEVGEVLGGGGGDRKGGRPQRLMFEEIESNKDTKGTAMSLLVQQTREAHEATVACWVEDSTHKFVENVLVSNAAALPTWQSKANGAKPNYDKETPHDSFILNTHTTAKAPFFVVIEIQKGSKTELYETQISSNQSTAALLKSKDNTLIKRAIIQI
jgi:Domain of unknown function (DUF4405)